MDSMLPPAVRRSGWILLAGLWIFAALALASFDVADWPSSLVAEWNEPIRNLCGRVGAAVAWHSYFVLGLGVWVLAIGTGAWLFLAAIGRPAEHALIRTVGLVIVTLAVSSLHALYFPQTGPIAGAQPGIVGLVFVSELDPRFSLVGSSLLLWASLAIGMIVTADTIMLALPRACVAVGGWLASIPAPSTGLLSRLFARPTSGLRRDGGASMVSALDAEDDVEEDEDVEWEYEDEEEPEEEEEEDGEWEYEYVDEDDDAVDLIEDEEDAEPAQSPKPAKLTRAQKKAARAAAAAAAKEASTATESKDPPLIEVDAEEAANLSDEELRRKIARLPVRMAATQTSVARDEDIPRTEDFRDYRFPTLDLLTDPEQHFNETMEGEVRAQAERLEKSLHIYGIDGEVVGIDSGPAVTLYSVELAAGTKVSKVNAVSTDIARSLKAQNIRIVPNMVGTTAIGIEVPNRKRERVRLKELMSGGHAEGMVLPMFLGKDASGEPLVADLTKMPHMLIAGTTGSGKSVCMNTILMSWLYTKRPDELKLVLVDPKMVEMSQFADIPHLMCPVVTESARAAAILEWAVDRMEERYELLKEARVQNIKSYNALEPEELYEIYDATTEEEQARIPKTLPYMVFVIDELADLMMTNKEVEHAIVRIAQKARAVGIHLVLATQRPQANVVTGLIKANMPCRISFKVASGMDSRIVLDTKGAELLLGQGDMMFTSPSSTELQRAQGTLVEDKEIRRVAKHLKEVAAPNFERSLIALRASKTEDEGGKAGLDASERDPLFEKAVEVMIESGRGSVSLLQRRLAIGYGRASRLVDQMSLAGIVGDHKGSVAREVLISQEDWDRMKSMEDEAEREGTIFEHAGDG